MPGPVKPYTIEDLANGARKECAETPSAFRETEYLSAAAPGEVQALQVDVKFFCPQRQAELRMDTAAGIPPAS